MKYVYNFRNILGTSNNVNIGCIYLSPFPLQYGIWDWWHDILMYTISAYFVKFDMNCDSIINILIVNTEI